MFSVLKSEMIYTILDGPVIDYSILFM